MNIRWNFHFLPSDHDFADSFLKRKNIRKDDLIIGFHPGSATLKNQANRRWEPEKYAELGRRLIKNNNAKILVFGGPEETELKNDIVESNQSEECNLSFPQ